MVLKTQYWASAGLPANLRGQLQPIRVHVGNYHVARSRVFGNRSSHDSYGPRASNEHVFPKHGKSKSGMNGVAERIEYGGDVKIDSVAVFTDVRPREHDVFRKRSGAVYADALGVSTKVAPSGHAVAAAGSEEHTSELQSL